MRPTAVIIFLLGCFSLPVQAEQPHPENVTVNWLDKSAPAIASGTSWGVPWPQGALDRATDFAMTDSKGQPVPVQTWPLAYWPDGSLKWTGHATTTGPDSVGPFTIATGKSSAPANPVSIKTTDAQIEITTGSFTCTIPKTGEFLIDTISIAGKTIGTHGRLICEIEDRSDFENKKTIREEDFTSRVDSVIVEQSGPVRAVVKITGMHKSDSADRAWLPFVVRLYFYAGVESIRMVHTFIFDGDQENDFIRGLGIRFSVPMREEKHNRHIRFAGDTGMFAEPIQVMVGRRNPQPKLYEDQVAGKRVPNIADLPNGNLVQQMAVWDDYKLTQMSADSYAIQKRTNPKSAWINAADGHRSPGLAFAGDVSGGLAVDLKNFWQLAPTGLEINHASTDSADLTIWLWSPDSSAMDMRGYDTHAHGLDASYEDWQPGFATATGVARTSELTIRPFTGVPAADDLLKITTSDSQPTQMVCTPEYLHAQHALGFWSLPDRSSPGKAWIENQLDKAITFYQGQVEQRHWYGFWDFGDVMHTYDPVRHEWRYDIGGFAWANTELMPNQWLWYSFLRSGRPDIFRMAENMTRQTQEVSVYHLGRFAGLGSRHNVRHWGDGAKEVRISQAFLKRFYYYLTTDERTGDLMNEVIDVDQKLVDVDPMREIEKKSQYPTHARVGPDWFALVSNWYTAWERTGDTKYRDKIIVGMNAVASMPHKIFSGASFGYDPATGMLYDLKEKLDVPSLAGLFGGPELNFEIIPVMNQPAWTDAFMQYCQYLSAPRAEQIEVLGNAVNTGRNRDFSRMSAYAAYIKKDPKLAARAWQQFLHNPASVRPGEDDTAAASREPFASHPLTGANVPAPMDEISGVSTNSTSQWCLNAIELLEFIGDQIPVNDPIWK